MPSWLMVVLLIGVCALATTRVVQGAIDGCHSKTDPSAH
jgi:hypothetical protein